ncbi:MAG: hypothetical protein R3E95_22970 [Thiolinea sp.]
MRLRYNAAITQKHGFMRDEYRDRAEDFDIRPRDPELKSANFSGGNQQKIAGAGNGSRP